MEIFQVREKSFKVMKKSKVNIFFFLCSALKYLRQEIPLSECSPSSTTGEKLIKCIGKSSI